jgi:hypothetical protein
MAAPPRDDEGRVKPHDDPDIHGDAWVVRHIIPDWLHAHPELPGRRRLSRAAFSPSSKRRDPYQGMSVDLLQPILDAGLSPIDMREDKYEASVRLRVADLRSLGLRVGPEPIRANPYHASVWGVTKGAGRHLVKLCQWVDKPDDVVDQ